MCSGRGVARTALAVVTALATAVVMWSAAPASAAERLFRDAADDAPARVDIRAVRVEHGTRALRLVVRVDRLRRNRGGGTDSVVVYVDHMTRRRGPEFYAQVEGFHAAFGRMRRWRPTRASGDPEARRCRGFRARYRTRADRVVFVLPRSRDCVGRIRRARVSATVAHPRDPGWSDFVVDHAPARREFYRWVRVG
jgi:hypothetical protein